VLQQSATKLGISSEALSRALQMLRAGTDYGFLRTSKAFDRERQRADEDLAFTSTHDALTVRHQLSAAQLAAVVGFVSGDERSADRHHLADGRLRRHG
jgi:hypothetical protein